MQRNLYPDTFSMHSFLCTHCLGQPKLCVPSQCIQLPHERAKRASGACAAQKHRVEMKMAAGTTGGSRQLPEKVEEERDKNWGHPV